jgi:hypothetical protein
MLGVSCNDCNDTNLLDSDAFAMLGFRRLLYARAAYLLVLPNLVYRSGTPEFPHRSLR